MAPLERSRLPNQQFQRTLRWYSTSPLWRRTAAPCPLVLRSGVSNPRQTLCLAAAATLSMGGAGVTSVHISVSGPWPFPSFGAGGLSLAYTSAGSALSNFSVGSVASAVAQLSSQFGSIGQQQQQQQQQQRAAALCSTYGFMQTGKLSTAHSMTQNILS